MIATAAEAERLLEDVRYCFYLLPFEPSGLRPSPDVEKSFDVAADQLASLNREVYFSSETIPEAAARLTRLSLQLTAGQQENEASPGDETPVAAMGTAAVEPIDMHLAHLETALADGKA